MSQASTPKKTVLKPIIISNNKKVMITNNQRMIIQPPKVLANMKKLPFRSIQQYKDEVIYSSTNCDFLKGDSQNVLIVNRMNLFNKSCRTVARCTSRGTTVETTSDSAISAIGQKNYETVLSALSSIFNEETKVRGILALLSVPKQCDTIGTQTTMEITEIKKDFTTIACQTDDTRLNMFEKKQRRRIRRQPLTPYVVTENAKEENSKVKKFVVNPSELKDLRRKKIEERVKELLPELRQVIDEDSNISSISNISASSWPSVPGILENTTEFLNQIDKVTDKTFNSTEIRLRDGSTIMIPVKPEDVFHIATPEVLKNVTHEERMKLIWHQAFIDFKMCLQQDDDGYYPLHVAVLNNDVDLVRRQCASLRARHETVDILAAGMTALQMAVRQNVSITCTNILLQNGADPLLCDQDRRCSLHLAAEIESPQLKTLLAYCDKHVRNVLKNSADYWRPGLDVVSDRELTRYLHNCITEMFDDQGYSPLMLACEAAVPSNVAFLAEVAGPLIDAPSPDCGNTALYRAVARACLHAKETGNTTTVPEKYLKTLEILVEHGADPSIENHSNSSVNTLLTEFNISSLSMTIANKMTAMKHGPLASDRLNMMLVKNSDGTLGYKDINNGKAEARTFESGLHAVITVNMPEKGLSKDPEVSIPNLGTEKGHLGNASFSAEKGKQFNIDNENFPGGNISFKDTNKLTELKNAENRSAHVAKDSGNSNFTSKFKHLNIVNMIGSSNNNKSYKDINTNKLIELKNAGTQNATEIKNVKAPQFKIGHIIWKSITDDQSSSKNKDTGKVTIENTNALKVNLQDIKDGHLGNVAFTKLSNGQMIAITQSPEGVPVSTDKKISLININSTPLKNVNNDTKNSILIKTSPNTSIDLDDEPTRSAKERKPDNVLIVKNVAVSTGFPKLNLEPSISKTAKAKDIVIQPKISPKIENKDTQIKELTMDDISPKIVIGKADVETVQRYRKRKLVSE